MMGAGRAVWWLAAGLAAYGVRGALAVVTAMAYGRFHGRRQATGLGPDAVTELITLLAIGVRAGLPLASAFSAAADEVGGRLADEVGDLLRMARLRGLAWTLAQTSGSLGPLASQLARAQVTGASTAVAIESHLATLRSVERSRISERSRTLPIRLIIPVSLLLLPGFVALVLGPVALDQLAGLAGTVRGR